MLQGFDKDPRRLSEGFVAINAYAKINLFLDVLNRRADNYHNIVSIMQTIDFCDSIEIKKSARLAFSSNTSLACDDSNLIIKAVNLITTEYGIPDAVDITLHKRIPMGAGLAGGSSNAAAAIHAMDCLFMLDMSQDDKIKLAARIGADVPFCIVGGTALMEGIGEIVTPLPPLPACHIVLVCPDIHSSTQSAFERLVPQPPTPVQPMLDAISGRNMTQIVAELHNVFTGLMCDDFPQICDIIETLKACGASGASMTGTGSAAFGLFEDLDLVEDAVYRLSEYHTIVCEV